ncbi:MAG TPA: hypothetical protein PKE30_21510 [Niabella sp.]|nr:hypothetical protein [Niabella sp.]
MKKQLILFLLSLLFLVSCGQTNKLSEEDYSWMPYKGDETLVFKSNLEETDTLFILKKDTLLAYPEAQALNGIKYEEVSVFCNHFGRNNRNTGRSYYFFKVQRAKDNRTELAFDLSAEGAGFYRISSVKIDSLSNVNLVSVETSYGKYDDVYIIYPDDYGKDFYNRSNFVSKLYWSKTRGLVRYDKKGGVYWELMK